MLNLSKEGYITTQVTKATSCMLQAQKNGGESNEFVESKDAEIVDADTTNASTCPEVGRSTLAPIQKLARGVRYQTRRFTVHSV
jgi:hypothetical protein